MRGSFFWGGVGWSGELSLRAKTQKSNHGLTLKWSLWDWRERELSSASYIFSRGFTSLSGLLEHMVHKPISRQTSMYKNKNKQIFKVQPSGANKMVYWLRALADKLYNLSSIHRLHRVEGENQLLRIILSDLHVHCGLHTHLHIHTENKKMLKNLNKQSKL